ncbi:hypothetical protein O0I10_010824 [Lichtheimia ornata]|uniref:CSN8/PSMD8/EIF3K domain-containing protein n=1 Tax=Lichtheimia ornata TaxID=688661 RepID=A0AAD7XUN6_9FUNG|nr:uncharacterized protein O0I10_010824 [Lichtheimia ornata]KAJ8653496.1 hypothetical protein O0I10_010824 [Lichtheimia ornata]
MDGIQQLIQNKDYAALVKACERVELQMAASPSANWNIQEIYAVLLLAYALVDDLNGARFLRKRILAAQRRSAEIDTAWRLCVIMWERRYDEFYEALVYDWSPLVLPLAESLRDTLRDKLAIVLQKTYTNMDLDTASRYFGMSEMELVPGLGWGYDTNSKMFTPAKPTSLPRHPSEMNQVSRLANTLLRLEQC